uniref:Uncharacterized protein n=1 Tax=viral metagenome TaxID=1070528 RepID=A0A6M3J4M3_9ZZZZ
MQDKDASQYVSVSTEVWNDLCDLVLNIIQVNRHLVRLVQKDKQEIFNRLESINDLCIKLNHRSVELEQGIIEIRKRTQ